MLFCPDGDLFFMLLLALIIYFLSVSITKEGIGNKLRLGLTEDKFITISLNHNLLST